MEKVAWVLPRAAVLASVAAARARVAALLAGETAQQVIGRVTRERASADYWAEMAFSARGGAYHASEARRLAGSRGWREGVSRLLG